MSELPNIVLPHPYLFQLCKTKLGVREAILDSVDGCTTVWPSEDPQGSSDIGCGVDLVMCLLL